MRLPRDAEVVSLRIPNRNCYIPRLLFPDPHSDANKPVYVFDEPDESCSSVWTLKRAGNDVARGNGVLKRFDVFGGIAIDRSGGIYYVGAECSEENEQSILQLVEPYCRFRFREIRSSLARSNLEWKVHIDEVRHSSERILHE